MNIYRKLLSSVVLVAVAACSGGGGDAGDPPFGGPDPNVPTAANLNLSLSTASVPNTGSVSVVATATAVTSQGVAVEGIPVSFSVDNDGLAVVPASSTDTQGRVLATVSIGQNRSNRVITVTATSGSLTRTAAFAVAGARLEGTAVPAIVTAGSPGEVRFRLIDANSNAMQLAPISVSATGLATVQGLTNASGEYVYRYTAPAITGTLGISAVAGGETATVPVQIGAATVPDAVGVVGSASVSANPSVVTVNTSSSTSNQTEIRALFVGAGNTAIPNIRVRFDLAGDTNNIGGTLNSGDNYVYTNANGIATTSYIAGARSSPTNGLTVRACWALTDFALGTCPNQALTTLTVVSGALSVTIGTNNVLTEGAGGLTYIKRFVVLVVDSAGQARADVQISPSIDLTRYKKGRYVFFSGEWVRAQTPSVNRTYVCANEDINRNGTLETSGPSGTEDVNGNGQLDPRKADVSVSLVGSSSTNASGVAILQIEYPKSLATWVDYNIEIAAAGVSGTEGRANYAGALTATFIEFVAVTPPSFLESPYGILESQYITKLANGVGPVLTYADGSTRLFCSE